MKQAGICFWMMIKRMGKHPVYWVLLLLFPAVLFVVPRFNRAAEKERILVGYVVEEAEGGEVGYSEKAGYGTQLTAGIEYMLQEEGQRETAGGRKLFQYIKYTDIDELKKDIMIGEATCGVVFDKDFTKKLLQQDYWHCITLYQPEGMNVGGMVQEDVFGRVYQAYSAVWYTELLEERRYQIEPDEVLQKFSEYQKDGKVFAVSYEVPGKEDERFQIVAGREDDTSSIVSLRGILAFLTLLSAMLGALDGSRDRKRGVGKGISCSCSLIAAAAGAPIIPATLFLAGGMLFVNIKTAFVSYTGGQTEEIVNITLDRFMMTEILLELSSALGYGLVLWFLAVVISRFVPEKLLEGTMPCFLLIILLCCPVFLDLGETIPLIGTLSKMFPITWYLEFWG